MKHNTPQRRIHDWAAIMAMVAAQVRGRAGQAARLLGAILVAGGLAVSPALQRADVTTAAGSPGAFRGGGGLPVIGVPQHDTALPIRRGAGRAPPPVGVQTTPLTGTVASTVPANGDVNPYGVAVVPRSVGWLLRGHLLVSNFNSKDQAGRGDTIVQIGPDDRTQQVFAQLDPAQLAGRCPGVGPRSGVGLTTALVVLTRGYVVVGSLPTSNGKPETAAAGCLIVLDSRGAIVRTIVAPDIQGPWGMTALDQGDVTVLFVTNALVGAPAALKSGASQGTVVRLYLTIPAPGGDKPRILTNTVIGSGFAERTDPAALVFGPTGVGFGRDGTLYVADTLENRIAAIPNALTRNESAYTGRDVAAGGDLNGPLGLVIAPGGDLLTVNGNDGKLVRTTPDGRQLKAVLIDATPSQGNPPGAGALFGLAVNLSGDHIYFGNDAVNSLNQVAIASTMP